MTKIAVNYYSGCAKVTGVSHEMIELEDPSLAEVVASVRRKHGRKLDELIWDEEASTLRSGISVLVNGRKVPMETRLKGSDEVAFLMAMAGG